MLTVDNTHKRWRCCVGWRRITVKVIGRRGNGKWFRIFGRHDIKRLLLRQLRSLWNTWSML